MTGRKRASTISPTTTVAAPIAIRGPFLVIRPASALCRVSAEAGDIDDEATPPVSRTQRGRRPTNSRARYATHRVSSNGGLTRGSGLEG